MRYLNNKKGLSDVVATVLIILLALAAVVIVWSFVSPSLRSSGTQINVQTKCLAMELKPTNCKLSTTPLTTSVTYQLAGGEKPNKIRFLFEGAGGTTDISAIDVTGTDIPDSLETKNKSLITYSLGPPIKVSLVAVILGDDGKEYNCSPSPVKIDCA